MLVIGGVIVAVGGIAYYLSKKPPQPPPLKLELFANADGDLSQWYGATPHYSRTVAMGVPYGTGDMVEENYKIETTSQTGTIIEIEVGSGKAAAGGYMDNYMRMLVRINGISYYGTWQLVDLYSTKSYTQIWNKNPAMGSNWTWDDINNLQIGMQGNYGEANDAAIECYNGDYRPRLTVRYEG